MGAKDLVLDIGSGGNPISSSRYGIVHADIRRCKHVDVRCDAHHLPFRDGCFRILYASHILEHLNHPLLALKEFKRVSAITMIKVPNARHYAYESPSSHLYSWNADTLRGLLSKVFSRVKIYPSVRKSESRGFRRVLKNTAIWILVALFRHNELTVICYE